MQKTIKVTKVDILKEGKSDKTGKEWVLFKVFCEGDDEMKEFSTFNADYHSSIGQQMRGNFAYNDQYKNWQETSAAKEAENSKHEEIMGALRHNYDKVADLENLLNAINTKVTGDIGKTETELKQDEINSQYKEEIEDEIHREKGE